MSDRDFYEKIYKHGGRCVSIKCSSCIWWTGARDDYSCCKVSAKLSKDKPLHFADAAVQVERFYEAKKWLMINNNGVSHEKA